MSTILLLCPVCKTPIRESHIHRQEYPECPDGEYYQCPKCLWRPDDTDVGFSAKKWNTPDRETRGNADIDILKHDNDVLKDYIARLNTRIAELEVIELSGNDNVYAIRCFRGNKRRFTNKLTKEEAGCFMAAALHLVTYLEESYGV